MNALATTMSPRRKKVLAISVILFLILGIILFIVFPPNIALDSLKTKPVILYYNFENLPFQPAQFPSIVNTTLAHHFNTLMLLVYYNHQAIFNESTLHQFFLYSKSKNLTFVPSYYVDSLADRINVSGYQWINLDLEKLNPNEQRWYYGKMLVQNVPLISVTSPYGQQQEFVTSLNIVESYSDSPWFWLEQLTYLHYSHACSVAVWLLRSQAAYDSQKNYCLRYTAGVMVFDYYNLLKTGFS
jgi:hypothetical protein